MQNLLSIEPSGRVSGAIRDIFEAFAHYHVWGLLGWQDIRQRYRRSVIGPFWLTLSTIIMVGSMGFLYARLFGQDVHQYLPHLAAGLIVWGTISTTVNESCTVFSDNQHIIRQIRLPVTAHVCRVVWRNLIMFAHNGVILIPLALWSKHLDAFSIASLPLGIVILVVNGLWVGLVLGMLCARFRDVPPIVANLMQIAFFLTPILWRPEILGNRIWAARFNPLYHLIEVIRAPILGSGFPSFSWIFLIPFTVAGIVLAVAMLARFRSRVPYWV